MKKKWIWTGIVLTGLLCILVIGVGAGILVLVNQRYFAQADLWGPAYSTNGMSLTLKEVSRERDQNGQTVITYDLSTVGVPLGQTYTLMGKNFPDESSFQLGEFRIDDSGKLLDAKSGQPFDHVKAEQYAMGQALNIALLNSDKSIRVYAKVIPFPIVVTDRDGCSLSVELLSRDGLSFMISGWGFEPNENIVVKERSENESTEDTITVDSSGIFSILERPAVVGKQSGMAYLNVIGKSCDLIAQHTWGSTSLQIQ